MNDPIVAEVRKAREEFARQFNYDMHAICEELRREEKLSGGGPLVSLPKRPAQTFPVKRPKETASPTPKRTLTIPLSTKCDVSAPPAPLGSATIWTQFTTILKSTSARASGRSFRRLAIQRRLQ